MSEKEFQRGEVLLYKNPQNEVELRVRVENETVWLTQAQIATLFNIERSVVTKHLRNIFQENELSEKVVCAIFTHTTVHGAIKGKTQEKSVKFYNLDAIISVGYRVNSQRATQFRVWATKTLKQYLVKGYIVNEKRLLEAREKFQELQTVIVFLQEKSRKELCNVFSSFSLWNSVNFC